LFVASIGVGMIAANVTFAAAAATGPLLGTRTGAFGSVHEYRDGTTDGNEELTTAGATVSHQVLPRPALGANVNCNRGGWAVGAPVAFRALNGGVE